MEHLIYGLALIVFGFLFGLEYGEEISIRAKILKEVGIIAEGFKTFYLGAGQISIPKPIHPDSVPELETCCDFEGFVKANDDYFTNPSKTAIIGTATPSVTHGDLYKTFKEFAKPKRAELSSESIVETGSKIWCYAEFICEEDEEKSWQEEMREDLAFYIPDVILERIITRFEEIVDQQK